MESLGNDDNIVITMTADSEDDYVPTRSLRKPKKADKVMLELPRKDLTKDTAALCVQLKLSHTAVTSICQDRTVWWRRTERFRDE